MEKKMKKIIPILFTLILTLSACAGASASPEGEWTLISYGDTANQTLALPNTETSISFNSDNQFNGNVGCNIFHAGYQTEKNTIKIQPIASTKMYCQDIAEQEDAILHILSEQTLNFEVNGNQLILTSSDGLSMIVLEKK